MHQHADPIAACCSLLGDVAEHHRLAAAGWQHEQDGAVVLPVRIADLVNGGELVGAELDHGAFGGGLGVPGWGRG